MQAKLIVVGGEVKTTEVKLKLPCVVGRGRGTGLMLPHPLVSRQHCEIYEHEGQLVVRDLGSLNGTYINNTRLTEPTLLPSGDLLTIGTVTFRAEYGEGAGPAPEPNAQTVRTAPSAATIPATNKQPPAEEFADFGEVEDVAFDEVEEPGLPSDDEGLLPPLAEDDLDMMSMLDEPIEEVAEESIPDAKPTARADASYLSAAALDVPAADTNETLRDHRQDETPHAAQPEAVASADDAAFLAGLGLAETLRPDEDSRDSLAETLLPDYANEPVAATDDLLADLGLDDVPSDTPSVASEAVAEDVADVDIDEIAVVDELAVEEVPALAEGLWSEPPVAEMEVFEEVSEEPLPEVIEESPAAELADKTPEVSEPGATADESSEELALDLPVEAIEEEFAIEEVVEAEDPSLLADLEPAAPTSATPAAEVSPDDFLASLGLDADSAAAEATSEPQTEQLSEEPVLEAASLISEPVEDLADDVLELDIEEIALDEIDLTGELPADELATPESASGDIDPELAEDSLVDLPDVDLTSTAMPLVAANAESETSDDAFAAEMLASLEPQEEPLALSAGAVELNDDLAPIELDDVLEVEAVVDEEPILGEQPTAETPAEEVSPASWQPEQPAAATDDDFVNDLMADWETPSTEPAVEAVAEASEEVVLRGDDSFAPLLADAPADDVIVEELNLEELDVVDDVLDIEELPLEPALNLPEQVEPFSEAAENPADAPVAETPPNDVFVDELLAEMSPEIAEVDIPAVPTPAFEPTGELSEPEFVEQIFAELTPSDTPMEEVEAVEIEEVSEELDVLSALAEETDFAPNLEVAVPEAEPLPFAAPLDAVSPAPLASPPPAIVLPPGSPPLARRPHAAPRPRGTPPGRNPSAANPQADVATPSTNGPANNGPTNTADAELDVFLKDIGQ